MHSAAKRVATEAGWRLTNLLRARRFFTVPEVMRLYKAQILSFIESSTAALYHAAPSTLEKVDRVQHRLLRELGLTEAEALTDYRLAPLCSRRDVAMLGLLHKVNLNLAPPQLQKLFAKVGKASEPLWKHRLRGWRALHDKQLLTPATDWSTDTLKRSAFGLAHCYNFLPQCVADKPSVTVFQKSLQRTLSKLAAAGVDDWQHVYSVGWRRFSRLNFDRLFNE